MLIYFVFCFAFCNAVVVDDEDYCLYGTVSESVSLKVLIGDCDTKDILYIGRLETVTYPFEDFKNDLLSYYADRVIGFNKVLPMWSVVIEEREINALKARDVGFREACDRLEVKLHYTDRGYVVYGAVNVFVDLKDYRSLTPLMQAFVSGEYDGVFVEEFKQMILFDYIVDNRDRFSGMNVLGHKINGDLLYIDFGQGMSMFHNILTAAFWSIEELTEKQKLMISNKQLYRNGRPLCFNSEHIKMISSIESMKTMLTDYRHPTSNYCWA